MPGFVYFLPNKTRLDAKLDKLRELGLGYAFEERAVGAEVQHSPSGERGVVVGDPAHVTENHLGYFADRQTWQKIPGKEIWVGFATASPPTPADLARQQQLLGHWVKLADDQRWLVPIARRVVPEDYHLPWYCALPQSVGLDEHGEWVANQPLARYAPLWRQALAWWDAMSAAELVDNKAQLDFAGLLDAAVLTLQANYRVSKIECALLALLTIEHAREVLNALIDWPTITAWLKKKADSETTDSSSFSSGPEAATLPTDQPARTSGN